MQEGVAALPATQRALVVPQPAAGGVFEGMAVQQKQTEGWSPNKLDSLKFFLSKTAPTSHPAAPAPLQATASHFEPDNQRPYLGLKYLLRAGPSGVGAASTWASQAPDVGRQGQPLQPLPLRQIGTNNSNRYAPYSIHPPSQNKALAAGNAARCVRAPVGRPGHCSTDGSSALHCTHTAPNGAALLLSQEQTELVSPTPGPAAAAAAAATELASPTPSPAAAAATDPLFPGHQPCPSVPANHPSLLPEALGGPAPAHACQPCRARYLYAPGAGKCGAARC